MKNLSQLVALGANELISIGKHPAGNALLEGGRSTPLEFAR
jgi:hypothetical protein